MINNQINRCWRKTLILADKYSANGETDRQIYELKRIFYGFKKKC